VCIIDYDDGETCTVWREERVQRARVRHTCRSCGSQIMPGRSYWKRHMVWDGTADTEACCDPCWAVAEAFGEAHHMTPTPSTLLEYLDQCVDQGEEGAERWRAAAREIRRKRERAWRREQRQALAVGAQESS